MNIHFHHLLKMLSVSEDTRSNANTARPINVFINGFAIRGPGFRTASAFADGLFAPKDMACAEMQGKQCFDNNFFGTSAQQAECTDPRQRLLKELTYEALVDAGVADFSSSSFLSADTGVYIGSSFGDFHSAMLSGDHSVQGAEHTGAAGAMLANSISHHFGLGGPSIMVDSACSSSFQALEIACGDIRSGKTKMAIVGGANVILDPKITAVYECMNVLSTSEPLSCKPFSDAADGYLRKEAVVVFVISNEELVTAGGLHSLAAILGSCSLSAGSGGKPGGGGNITTPNLEVQEMLYRKVAAMAAPHLIDNPGVVQYIECHATGTRLGDEVETAALANTVKAGRLVKQSLYDIPDSGLLIGSVKSNIGHTEAASGLVGLVKVLLSLEAGMIPRQLNYCYEKRNRKCAGLDDGSACRVVEKAEPIERDAIVVINSFGFGGTYVQFMIRGTPQWQVSENACVADAKEPWRNINPLVGRTQETALATSSAVSAETFSAVVGPPDVCIGNFSARAFSTPKGRENHACVDVQLGSSPRPVWLVFTGNGADWPLMGFDLYQNSFGYKETYDRCNEYLRRIHNCHSLQVLLQWQQHQETKETGKEAEVGECPFRDIADATVALTALQICLIDLLRMAGFTRDNCCGYIGYSAGEIAAGYFDTSVTFEETLAVAVCRGRAAVTVAAQCPGGMLSVLDMTREEMESFLSTSSFSSSIDVACHTGPCQLTLSGLQSECNLIKEELLSKNSDVRIRSVETFGVAFHSRLIDESVLADLASKLDVIFGHTGRKERSCKWISTCFENGSAGSKYAASTYHCRGFRDCVEFERACKHIPPNALVIECGPSDMFRSVFTSRNGNELTTYMPLLKQGTSAIDTLATVYGNLFLEKVLFPDISGPLSPRAAFPAAKQRSTREAFFVWDHSKVFSKYLQPRCPLLENTRDKCRIDGLGSACVVFDLEGDDCWLRGHRVDGRCLLPAAVYLYIVWNYANLVNSQQCSMVDFSIHQPVDISALADLWLRVQFTDTRFSSPEDPTSSCSITNANNKRFQIAIFCTTASKVTADVLVASGIITIEPMNEARILASTATTAATLCSSDGVDVRSLYHQMGRHGYDYGDAFKVLSWVEADRSRALIAPLGIEVSSASADVMASQRKVCILALEAMLQLGIAHDLSSSQYGPCQLPIGIENICFFRSIPMQRQGTTTGCSVRVGDLGAVTLSDNNALAELTGIRLQPSSTFAVDVRADVGKISLAPVSDKYQNNRTLMDVGDVQVLNFDNSTDKFELLALIMRDLRRGIVIGQKQHCIVISEADWFPGFIRSLCKEPGYSHLRGIRVLNTGGPSGVLTACDCPAVSLQIARSIFTENDDICCLFLDMSSSSSSSSSVIMTEQNKTVTSDTAVFPSPHGCFLALASPLSVSTYSWRPIEWHSRSPDTCSVDIEYASLNFRDIMIGTRTLHRTDAILGYGSTGGGFGLDFAGYRSMPASLNEQGCQLGPIRKKVIGLGRDCIADRIFDQPNYLLWELPDDAELEQYATVPCAYATAYYALCERGLLQETDRVLIHCGAGGVGLAALYICTNRLKDISSQLFVTCSNDVKRRYIHDTFGLPIRNIGDSCSPSFKQLVMTRTNGIGVNMVLNSLVGALMQASVDCLNFGGRLLELGKADINPAVTKELRRKDRQLVMIDLDQLMTCQIAFAQVRAFFMEGLTSGEIVPLFCKVYSLPDGVSDAFDYMLSRDRIGKVLLKNEKQHSLIANEPSLLSTFSTSLCSNSKESLPMAHMIIIVGGLGCLGLCLVQLLASRLRSACSLLLCTHSEGMSHEQQRIVDDVYSRYGTIIEIRVGDFSQRIAVDDMLASLSEREADVKLFGFFNMAGVINDALFDSMEDGAWESPFVSKSTITENFSHAFCDSRFVDATSSLKHFVCISSIVAELGNRGQCNYAASNVAMEEIVMRRVACGVPGLCVRLGLVPHTGLANLLPANTSYEHLSPVSIEAVMVHLERLIVGGESGIFSVYGKDSTMYTCSSCWGGKNDKDKRPVASEPSNELATILDIFNKHAKGGVIQDNTLIGNSFDSLGVIVLLRALQQQLSMQLSLSDLSNLTPMEVTRRYLSSCSGSSGNSENGSRREIDRDRDIEIVVIATIGRSSSTQEEVGNQKECTTSALFSIRDQIRLPDHVLIVFEGSKEDEMILTEAEVRAILPSAAILYNKRTKRSVPGALNTGVMRASTAVSSGCGFWISFLDTTKHHWQRNHIAHCLISAVQNLELNYGWVIAADNQCSLPSALDIDFFLHPTATRSSWLVHSSIVMEAGLFDEALDSMIDDDLAIRMCDIMLCHEETNENKTSKIPSRIVSGMCTIRLMPYAATCTKECDCDFDLFLYKHNVRMTQAQLIFTMDKLGYDHRAGIDERSMQQDILMHEDMAITRGREGEGQVGSEYTPVALELWSSASSTSIGDYGIGDDAHITVRKETSDLLNTVCSLPTSNTLSKMLVGVTTGDTLRIAGLLRDLANMPDVHGVVVFANSNNPELANKVLEMLQNYKFRSRVIRSTDPIIRDYFPADSLPLPIAISRSVLQKHLYEMSTIETFDAIAVLDDDIRLPRNWGIRLEEDNQAGDILLGRAIKTPPNVTVMSMRTQLLDFMHSLDVLHSPGHNGCDMRSMYNSSYKCPSLQVFNDLHDQYYDLSAARWNHLEIPRLFDLTECGEINIFVETCKRRILVGDPLARDAVSVEDGPSCQRGGCMVLLSKNFNLLRTAQMSPTVQLASGRHVSSRRSDTFWVQYHCKDTTTSSSSIKAVARRHLSFVHDNTHDPVPSQQALREAVALEMIGAILCRPSEERDEFARGRSSALMFSVARIRGICKALRGRRYFAITPALSMFVECFESLCDAGAWQRDVFDVINVHVQKLKSWNAHDEPPQRAVLLSYALPAAESVAACVYPNINSLCRDGPLLPIPCLHRIHTDVTLLQGAHKIQYSLGMSLSLSEVELHLRRLAALVAITRRYSRKTWSKALVTIDDGFRDVLLLRPIFSELSDSIQPVLCVPSSILRSNDNNKPYHLPLTCLYQHCEKHNIAPDNEYVLGNASRGILKALPEKKQFEALRDASISVDLPTHDLLSYTDLASLSTEGWWICSHGPDHSDLTKAPSFGVVLDELIKDFAWIKNKGWAPWFAWPEGKWNARITDQLVNQNGGATVQFGLSSVPKGEAQHLSVISRAAWFGGERKPCVLVTGSDGFLGRHLVLVLHGYGYDVYSYDITTGHDIMDRDKLLNVLRAKKISACVHLAAIADLNAAEDEPDIARRINVEGTRIVLSCCEEVGVRMLFASTCCVYGNNGESGSSGSSELSAAVPTEIYAETKLEGEKHILRSARKHELRHVIMRLATFYGPGMRHALATSLFLRAAENREPINIHGSGDQTRCYTHVHDIVEGIRVILQTLDFSGVINLADDREVSVNELAYMAMRVTGNIVPLIHREDRKGQIRRSKINNNRLRGLGNVGWVPTVTLEDGLAGCMTHDKYELGLPLVPLVSPTGTTSDCAPSAITSSSTTTTTTTTGEPSECCHAKSVEIVRVCPIVYTTMPTNINSNGTIGVTEQLPDSTQLIAYVVGNVQCSAEVAVRIHSECFFGDVLDSRKCDCGPQKDDFLQMLGADRPGVLVYIKGHEGRGAGLATKTRAYSDVDRNPLKHHSCALMDAGATAVDSRRYAAAATFLLRVLQTSPSGGANGDSGNKDISSVMEEAAVMNIVLYTNNSDKVDALQSVISGSCQFRCQQRVMPAGNNLTQFNRKYLIEKEQDSGHCGLSVCGTGSLASVLPTRDMPTTTVDMGIPGNIDELGGIETVINEMKFDAEDEHLENFFKENGYCVIRGLLSAETIKAMQLQHEDIVHNQYKKVCSHVGGGTEIKFQEYAANISQVRDLFLRKGSEGGVGRVNVFKELVFDDKPTSVGCMAQRVMTAIDVDEHWREGIKLLHDHTIRKPAGLHVSKKIPLHQDRMFWPTDNPACSTFIPFTDVPLNGGCLELITLQTKPHLNAKTQPAVDFMADELTSGLKAMLTEDPHPVRHLIPMEAGDMLMFSSNAWHRSSPNGQLMANRDAYIITWVHPHARWRPDLVPWHPVNEHLELEGYKPGQFLAGERHPTVGFNSLGSSTSDTLLGPTEEEEGRKGVSKGIYARNDCAINIATKQRGSHISMFDASNVVSTQIKNIIALKIVSSSEGYHRDMTASLVDILTNVARVEELIDMTQEMLHGAASINGLSDDIIISSSSVFLFQESGCTTLPTLLSWILKRIMLSAAAYECHRSRNVFNSAYDAWWSIAGAAWNQYFLSRPFNQDYRLCTSDVDRFLKRIHLRQDTYDRITVHGKLELLTAIIRGCMQYIPFQNFTMLTRLQPPIERDDSQSISESLDRRRPPTLGEVIDDMLTGIGGLCVVRNPFLLLLLKALQFENVRFVTGTMCPPGLSELPNAHTALLVCIGSVEYWVDIANGYPYMSAIPLDSNGTFIIKHPFVNTRLVKKTKDNREVFVVEHDFFKENDWTENYYFESTAVDYDVAFGASISNHYDSKANFGPFLSHLRFNLWSESAGFLLRDEDLKILYNNGDCFSTPSVKLGVGAFSAASEFFDLIHSSGFVAEPLLVELMNEAWFRCQKTAGNILEAEKITVTGGFFDDSANGYVGMLTVWRCCKNNNVKGLTFQLLREYVPDKFPVINKGFAGGSWYDNDLYVCWPNCVAVISPLSATGWAIASHIHNPCFNDLHHVHACEKGVWVANTGFDSVDHLGFDGQLIGRARVAEGANIVIDALSIDIRSQAEHNMRRGQNKEHVNHVYVVEEPLSLSKSAHVVTATLLQSKRVVRIENNSVTETVLKLCATQPPHEGFLATARSLHLTPLLWNSTVDGHVVASDPSTGGIIRSWNLFDYTNIPHGWTRGLCILDDGFLVASTAIRGSDAEQWIKKHDNVWNFETTHSQTGVAFIPFDAASSVNCGKSNAVEFLTNRRGKIFSLLHTPLAVRRAPFVFDQNQYSSSQKGGE
jgi:acyl transferase domain-containing protein/nucleoside-diphosphate-sugar epimerase/NADPH:quinone reductase-like Zn-dependent oxidoreductase/GTP cyclohydrolase II/arylamine N-acetyltransferase